ncbi:MAG: FMN reductase [Intrasporangium sp.]|uniref:FMN reductase n=1 Tax=Intrasporangium sp. TaxID=1925024 RepID=UPI00264703DE|nr:FMN reductase [Intrasporangium sp.]MDN5794586.1 FMN reductase [Intrasporangium sp.]
MTTRIAVITAGITEPSSTRLLADRLAEATVAVLGGRRAVSVEVVDVRRLAHEVTNTVLTGFASPALQERLDTIAAADAVIVSTPIYSASYSGLFKMLVDVLPRDALRDKPVLLGATGGTARHSLAIDHALRPLFAHLGALVVPVAVFAASEDWGSTDAGRLSERIERAGAALARLVTGAPAPALVDPFEDVTPFEALLADVAGVSGVSGVAGVA